MSQSNDDDDDGNRGFIMQTRTQIISFKLPALDTCITCDTLKSIGLMVHLQCFKQLYGASNAKEEAQVAKEYQLKKSEMVTAALRSSSEAVKLDSSKCCLFDFSKKLCQLLI